MELNRDELLKSVEDAIKLRAQAYSFIYDEISSVNGKEKADEIFKKAIYKLGSVKSSSYNYNAKTDASILSDEFVNKDTVHKEIFKKQQLSSNKNECVLEMKKCPLVEKWKQSGIDTKEISHLCDLAYQIDFGTFETLGYKLNFRQRLADGADSCILELKKK